MRAVSAVQGLICIDPRVGCVGDYPESYDLAWSANSNIGVVYRVL
jgi:hypothetical protein